jgi:hydrogenase assembly chaperone HypC/HupF
MCLDFAARILERDGDSVLVESEGRRRRASTLLMPDIAVGDWVYVAAGTVIERLDPDDAALANELLRSAQGALT